MSNEAGLHLYLQDQGLLSEKVTKTLIETVIELITTTPPLLVVGSLHPHV